MALMLGALMIHGIAPGPRVITENPDLFWGLVVSFLIGNFMLLVLNIPLIQFWVKILQIPYRFLFPAIVLLICVGVYSLGRSTVDVMLVAGFSSVGYLLIKLGFEAAPLLLGFILGPMLEENMRRSLLLSRGDFATFIERPISAAFLGLAAILLIWVIKGELKRKPAAAVSHDV
jgi:TctA family transporter